MGRAGGAARTEYQAPGAQWPSVTRSADGIGAPPLRACVYGASGLLLRKPAVLLQLALRALCRYLADAAPVTIIRKS
jgi:hypothetical protein